MVEITRTAVADYGDEFPGVLEITARPKTDAGPYISIHNKDGSGSVIIGTHDQAKQLIEALQAGIREIWEK